LGRALFYVTGHGFGHATRTRALIAALRARLGPDLAIHVRSDAPHWIFTDRDPDVTCSAAAIDPGVLQPNGLDLDLPRTLAAQEAFVAGWDERVTEEAAFVRGHRATLVVGDVPPLAFAAARAAGVPAVAVANFSWDWIFAAWADREPRFGAIAARYRRAYAEAETLFRLPLHGDLAAFASTVDVPLLVNRSSRDRAACRADLGLAAADSRRVVLVSFGGLGPGTVAVSEPEDLAGYVFVGMGAPPPGFRGAWIELPAPSRAPHEDLVSACDAVLGKPGYSSVAEALAHRRRFLALPRDDFREAAVLQEGLERLGCARVMPREDFAAGRWRAHLDALFDSPASFAEIRCDGAEVIADALAPRLAP
jgi:L-arabinokinase